MGARKTILGYEPIGKGQVDHRMMRLMVGSLGQPYRIRSARYSSNGKPVVYEGKIHSVEPGRWRIRGASKVAQFRVYLVCGSDMVIREFMMEKLPG